MDLDLSPAALAQRARPMILEFWAPWCGPCRAMAPHLERLGEAFAGQVDLVKVNAGEQPDLAAQWGVRSVPTIVAVKQGQEVLRLHGSQSPAALADLFRTLAEGGTPTKPPLSGGERLLRGGTGAALVGLAVFTAVPWPVGLVGGLVLFSAVHDRCPLLQALRRRRAEQKQVASHPAG